MAFSIKQANVWHGDALDSCIVSVSVQADGNPRIGCEIAAELAEHDIPVAFATVRPSGFRYEAVYGFSTQAEADRAMEVINGIKARRNATPRRRAA